MIIRDSFVVPAPRSVIAAFILDVDRVKDCVPGIEGVSEISEDEYESTIQIQMGPISAVFKGTLTLDRSKAPEQLAAQARGTDQRTGSVAAIEGSADLTEVGEAETRVDVVADITIRGRLGQFGTGLIESTAKEVIGQFASCVISALEEGGIPQAPASLGRTMTKGVVNWLKALLQDFVSRISGKGSSSKDGSNR